MWVRWLQTIHGTGKVALGCGIAKVRVTWGAGNYPTCNISAFVCRFPPRIVYSKHDQKTVAHLSESSGVSSRNP
jgi:hypothetical protein